VIDSRKLFLALALLYLVFLAMPGCSPAAHDEPGVPDIRDRHAAQEILRAVMNEEQRPVIQATVELPCVQMATTEQASAQVRQASAQT
jgi:hypothetical protein